MARAKKFDPEKALAAAMNVFWRLGYENNSLDVLTEEMDVARQSLYDTFGDKRSLYLKALAHYRNDTNGSMRHMFQSVRSVKDGFAQLLLGLSRETRAQHARGCLLLSANMERAAEDPVVAKFLRDNQAEVEAIFAAALRSAQSNGELSSKKDPEALARFFVATIQGMRALARLKSDRVALEQVAKVALAVLD
jgi:TetR/AcrR family transcriptional regulator, transcriptional repressor for nem operon